MKPKPGRPRMKERTGLRDYWADMKRKSRFELKHFEKVRQSRLEKALRSSVNKQVSGIAVLNL